MPGYVFLYRDIDRHWVWSDGRTAHRWMDLLIQAAWQNKTVYFGGVKVDLKRGQLITTTRLLMGRWKTNPKMVLKVLDMFEEDKMIRCKKLKDMTLISICNFDVYQSNFNASETAEFSPYSISNSDENRKHGGKRQGKRTKENKKEENKKTKTTSGVESAPTHEEVFEDFFNEQAAVDTFCSHESIDLDTCKKIAREVLNDWVLRGQVHETLSDGREHLLNQLRIKLSIYKREQNVLEQKRAAGKKQKPGVASGDGRDTEPNPLARAKTYTANISPKD